MISRQHRRSFGGDVLPALDPQPKPGPGIDPVDPPPEIETKKIVRFAPTGKLAGFGIYELWDGHNRGGILWIKAIPDQMRGKPPIPAQLPRAE